MSKSILNNINSPLDLKAVSEKDIPKLCAELREELVEQVEKSGGHLASNLGVTELTVAIHRVFESPKDHVIFDVGHQAYVHKLLTGRRDRFANLRAPGGLSGFTLMRESEHDAFGAGHSSTSISAALGYAEAAALRGSDEYTVCVIGDGSYTGGMVHEALNNCKPDLRLIIILNENGMSISGNKGTFANYLSKARTSTGYNKLKKGTRSVIEHIPLIGKPLKRLLSFFKKMIKDTFMHPNYFEELGLYYIGPVDGNDYKKVAAVLERAKRTEKCVVVHLKTVKGKGYTPAEQSPTEFHNVRGTGADASAFHTIAADEIVKIAENDEKIVAVTAAMGTGTSLDRFEYSFPKRYFDVGIAEEHAVTFSAGLAAAGLSPYVAIYSTFLQRGYDNLLHDVALQDLPVRIMIDRAGLAPSDGATHHGIFDVAFLSHTPGIELCAPATYDSLRRAIRASATASHPLAIRYPNTGEQDFVEREFTEVGNGEYPFLRTDISGSATPDVLLLTYGSIVSEVREAKALLSADGISAGILLVERIKPYSEVCRYITENFSGVKQILYVEEGIKNGGAAMITEAELRETGFDFTKTDYAISAIDDDFVAPDHLCNIYDHAGLSAKKIYEKCKYLLSRT